MVRMTRPATTTRLEIPPEVHGNGRFLRSRRDFEPAYLRTYREGRLREKVERALASLADCTVWPPRILRQGPVIVEGSCA